MSYGTLDSLKEDNHEAVLLDVSKNSVAIPLLTLLIAQFILFISVGILLPSIPLYASEVGLSKAMTGLIISIPAAAMVTFAKYAGNYADLGRKPAMIYGLALILVSEIGTAFANGIVILVLVRLGEGIGRCISESGERGMLTDFANKIPERRGRVVAAQQTVVALGIFIGAPIGGVLIEEFGPRTSFLCVSVAAFIAIIFYTMLPETISLSNEQSKNNDNFLRGNWTSLLSINMWKGLALCQCGTTFGFSAKIVSIPILATETLPGGATAAGALISAAGLSNLIGTPIGGWLTDRTGSNTTVILGGIISAIGFISVPITLQSHDIIHISRKFAIATQTLTFSAAVLTWSIGASIQGPALIAIAQKMAPEGAEATALALPKACRDATFIVAPILLGLVADSIKSIPGIECAVAGGAGLLGVMAFTFLSYEH